MGVCASVYLISGDCECRLCRIDEMLGQKRLVGVRIGETADQIMLHRLDRASAVSNVFERAACVHSGLKFAYKVSVRVE